MNHKDNIKNVDEISSYYPTADMNWSNNNQDPEKDILDVVNLILKLSKGE